MTSFVRAPRAHRPHMVRRPAETGENSAAGVEILRLTARDYHQILRHGHGARPAHGGIEKVDSPLFQIPGETNRILRTRGRRIKMVETLFRPLGDAARPESGLARNVAVGQRADDEVHASGGFSGRLGGMAAFFAQIIHASGVHVEALHLEARLMHVLDERLAHQSHAHDTHTLRHTSFSSHAMNFAPFQDVRAPRTSRAAPPKAFRAAKTPKGAFRTIPSRCILLMGAHRCWCAAWTSNPVDGANHFVGGFDSHAFPPVLPPSRQIHGSEMTR